MKISFEFDQTTKVVSNITVDGAGSVSPPPAALLVDNGDGTVTLTKTGHKVPKPQPENGEMFVGYFQRIATLIGSNPQIAGSLFLGIGASEISKTGDPKVDWPINLDAFANATVYGTGSAGGGGEKNYTDDLMNAKTPTGVGNLFVLPDRRAGEGRRKFSAKRGEVYAYKATMPPFSPVIDAAPQVVGSCAIVPSGSGDVQGHLSRFLEGFTPTPGGAGGTCYDRMEWTPEIAGTDIFFVFALGPNQSKDEDLDVDFQVPTAGTR